MKHSSTAGRAGYYTTSVTLAVLFLFPLAWSAESSLSTPHGKGLDNFSHMLHYGDGLGTYLVNSLVVTGLTVAGTLAVSILGGYAFGRFSFPGKNVLFVVTLAILMVPYPTILIPLYVMLGWFDLQNSLL